MGKQADRLKGVLSRVARKFPAAVDNIVKAVSIEAANAIIFQSFGIASFFLLLSIFTLLYLLNLKYNQFTTLTTVVHTESKDKED